MMLAMMAAATSIAWGPCPTKALTEGGYRCAVMTVPERWDTGAGAVKLPVVIRPGSKPGKDSVLFFIGGPGGTNIGYAPSIAGHFAAIEQDVVFVERRGAGFSQPGLFCPPEITREDLPLDGVRACADALKAKGVDLDGYDTASAAKDAEAARKLLGVERWNLFGASYGTTLALETLREFPGSVRSVVLDSPYPPSVDMVGEGPGNHDAALQRLFAACREDAACNAAYPDLPARFTAVGAGLDERPMTLMGRIMKREEYLGFVGSGLSDGWTGPRLPLAIDLIGQRRAEDLMKLLTPPAEYAAAAAKIDVPPENARQAIGLWVSVECAERAPFAGTPTGEWRTEYRGALLAACKVWPSKAVPAAWREPVASETPVLIFAGEFDPVTPFTWGERALKTLPNGRLYVIPHGGHTSGLDTCPMTLADAFYDDPKAALDDSCLKTIPPFVLKLP
jgi:pimeloyl-ACP methyl ester carboxylesterase